MARKIEKTIDAEQGTVTVGFASGSTTTISMRDLPKNIVAQLALHGLSQKVTDAGAGKTPEETEEHVMKVVESLKAGNWTVRGEGGSGGTSRVTQLVRAVARLKGIDLAEAKAKVSALTDEEKKSLQAAPAVQAAILEIKAEDLAAKKEKGSEDAAKGDSVLGAL